MINDPVWYLSAMLIAMLILYPALRKFPDMFINVIAPLVVLFFLGYLSNTYGSLIINYSDYNLVYPGILRAIAEISLGCISFGICRKLLDFKKAGKLALSIVELSCYALVFYLANISYNSRTDFIILLFLMVGITITFSQQSIWNNLFQNKFCFYLGRLSMALFLCHYCINRIFLTGILKLSIKPLFAVYLLSCLALSVICLLVVDGIKYVYKRHRNRKANYLAA
jgi:peptidoglycan/LPS O-acetylase OafA/YrhL